MATRNHNIGSAQSKGVNISQAGHDKRPPVDSTANSIRFSGHHSGALEMGRGATPWGYLPAIFTLANTRQNYSTETCSEPFQTDTAGLDRLADMSESAEGAIADAIEVIGDLLANCETEELDPGTVRSIGWLLSGLSELRGIVAFTRSDAAFQLTGDYAATGATMNKPTTKATRTAQTKVEKEPEIMTAENHIAEDSNTLPLNGVILDRQTDIELDIYADKHGMTMDQAAAEILKKALAAGAVNSTNKLDALDEMGASLSAAIGIVETCRVMTSPGGREAAAHHGLSDTAITDALFSAYNQLRNIEKHMRALAGGGNE
jgi:hypothetical protein